MNETKRKTSSSFAKCPVCNGSLAEEPRKETNSKRIHVRVTSRRSRLIDPDNLCAKYFVDCLRYAGFIPDDNADIITLEVRQEKVSKKDEETVIEVLLAKVISNLAEPFTQTAGMLASESLGTTADSGNDRIDTHLGWPQAPVIRTVQFNPNPATSAPVGEQGGR